MLPFDETEQLTYVAQRKAFEAQNAVTEKIAELMALYTYMASKGDFVSAAAIEAEFLRFYDKHISDFVSTVPGIVSDIVIDYSEQWYNSSKLDIPLKQNTQIYSTMTQNASQAKNLMLNISLDNVGITEQLPNGKIQFTSTRDFFRNELNDGITQVVAGNKTYTEVTREIVDKMAKSGIRTMTSPSRTERIEVVTRRAIMTGIKDTITDNAYEMARQMGTTFFEISLHEGARESHWWGGYRFSTVPMDVVDLQTGKPFVTDEYLREKSGAWLTDYNCRHYITPIDKDEKPVYNRKRLEEHQAREKALTEYKGKEYTLSTANSRMRELEREMRALRLKGELYKSVELKDDYTEARLKYRTLRAEYADFAKAMNIKTQYERISIDMLGRVF